VLVTEAPVLAHLGHWIGLLGGRSSCQPISERIWDASLR